jgi:hypothetical protein
MMVARTPSLPPPGASSSAGAFRNRAFLPNVRLARGSTIADGGSTICNWWWCHHCFFFEQVERVAIVARDRKR